MCTKGSSPSLLFWFVFFSFHFLFRFFLFFFLFRFFLFLCLFVLWWCVVVCGLCCCDVVCCRGVVCCWRCVVVVCCGVFGLCCVVVVCCGVSRWKTSVCAFKTSACVRSKRLRVFRHHAHILFSMCAWCRHTRETFWTYTRRRFECTHGGSLSPLFLPFSLSLSLSSLSFSLSLFLSFSLSLFSFLFHLPLSCWRFLQSFALPDRAVQLQLPWVKQAERNVKNDLHVSIAKRLHTIFAHFFEKNALPSMMFAFRSLWPSTMTSCFFASRCCFKHFSRLQALLEMWNQVGLEVSKSAWNSYENQKTWSHCGRSKASKSKHHGR